MSSISCRRRDGAILNGLILVTDREWFDYLSQQKDLDEVNFWRPSDTRTPQQLRPGMPVLFKLRKKFGGWIVGLGMFARHAVLPAWLAWDSFEAKNGAGSFADMCRRIARLRRDHGGRDVQSGDYKIGCLMLAQPVFLPNGQWVRSPADWPDNVVQGKMYDLAVGEGARVWSEVLGRAQAQAASLVRDSARRDDLPRYGEAILVKPRLGQGTFRIAVTDAYGAACAVTSEHSLPALEAGHIRPFSDGGRHEVPNGLLLRSDIHRLYDKGYVGITPDYRFVVSDHLKTEYSNGRSYYPLHGQAIHLPHAMLDRPDVSQLEWHLNNRFRG
jgi:putative restriction endonuclease